MWLFQGMHLDGSLFCVVMYFMVACPGEPGDRGAVPVGDRTEDPVLAEVVLDELHDLFDLPLGLRIALPAQIDAESARLMITGEGGGEDEIASVLADGQERVLVVYHLRGHATEIPEGIFVALDHVRRPEGTVEPLDVLVAGMGEHEGDEIETPGLSARRLRHGLSEVHLGLLPDPGLRDGAVFSPLYGFRDVVGFSKLVHVVPHGVLLHIRHREPFLYPIEYLCP